MSVHQAGAQGILLEKEQPQLRDLFSFGPVNKESLTIQRRHHTVHGLCASGLGQG